MSRNAKNAPPRAVVIGGGPAGLTAAYELLERTDIIPVVYEAGDDVGGISRTFNYKGNRIDLGGHRFFSKSDRVMEWWQRILPIRAGEGQGDDGTIRITYRNDFRDVTPNPPPDAAPGGAPDDDCMLVRGRVSRILFRGKFFDYPLSFSPATVAKLGLATTVAAGFSYLRARLFPTRPERTLEDFVINRFGRYLYAAFFRDYTRKVWGVPCTEIPADWGAQRIKGLSVTKLLKHALKKVLAGVDASAGQKSTETSLIERFLYPKYGPGHMWARAAQRVREMGGAVELNKRVVKLETRGHRVVAALVEDTVSGKQERIEGSYFFSTMPVRELISAIDPPPPPPVREVADGLPYRDFLTVGILARRLSIAGGVVAAELTEKLPDNWIYVQEPDVMVGRIQIFNNWSPYLVADPRTIWLGMEYFLNESDPLWRAPDEEVAGFAASELAKIGFLDEADLLDSVVIRQKKAYPAYFGTYGRFHVIRDYLAGLKNLFLLGRNGQHRYNNQDHSMLTAMIAVDGIVSGAGDTQRVWEVNTEEDYHEAG